MSVSDLADLAHRLLEHAMRGRIGDHAAGKIVRMLFRLGAKIVEVDVAVFLRLHRHDRHADHLGRCRVGAVG
ncbi:hypothetical protein D3C87_2123860 [compost metagenome]